MTVFDPSLKKEKRYIDKSECGSGYFIRCNAEAADDVHSDGCDLADVLDPLPHRVSAPPAGPGTPSHTQCGPKSIILNRMMRI